MLIRELRWLSLSFTGLWRRQAIRTTLTLCAASLSVIDPLIMKWVIDTGLPLRSSGPVAIALGLFFLVHAARLAAQYFGSLLATSLSQRVMFRIRLRLLRALAKSAPESAAQFGSGDIVRTLTTDVEQAGQFVCEVLPSLARILLVLLFCVVIMSSLSPLLTLSMAPCVVAFAVVRLRLGPTLRSAAETARSASGDHSSSLTEWVGALEELNGLGIAKTLERRYAHVAALSARLAARQSRIEAIYGVASAGLFTIGVSLAIATGVAEVWTGALSIGGFVAFYGYVSRLFEPVGSAIEMYAKATRTAASIRRVATLADLPPHRPVQGGTTECDEGPIANAVECSGVAFTYRREQRHSVLTDVNLSISQTERLALVGETGSGKSTLGKIMAGIYRPSTGTVSLRDANGGPIVGRDIGEYVAVVNQFPAMFRGSLHDNVTLGNRHISTVELDAIAHLAAFDDVVRRRGWEYELGWGGQGLSGGERQRAAIVRALVQERPFLILDEATSALDAETERIVLERLQVGMPHVGILFISHRQAVADWAGRVVRLTSGQVDSAPIVLSQSR